MAKKKAGAENGSGTVTRADVRNAMIAVLKHHKATSVAKALPFVDLVEDVVDELYQLVDEAVRNTVASDDTGTFAQTSDANGDPRPFVFLKQ